MHLHGLDFRSVLQLLGIHMRVIYTSAGDTRVACVTFAIGEAGICSIKAVWSYRAVVPNLHLNCQRELVQSINAQRVEIDKLTETQKADKQHLMQKIDAQTGRLDQAYCLIWSMRYPRGTHISAKILTCWSQSRGSLQKFVLSRGILCTARIVRKHFIRTLNTREGLT